MTIVLFDKDGGVGGFLQRFEFAASSKSLDVKRVKEPEKLGHEDAQLIVAHITQEYWQQLLLHSSKKRIVLRVSSAGFPDAPSPEVIDQTYVLHLVRPAKTEVDFDRLLEVLGDITNVETLIYEKQPEEIYNYFARQTVTNLVALCILCQGYLAIHAEKDGQNWGPPEISTALAHLKWPSIGETAAPLLGPDLRNKRSEVESPVWWSRIFAARDELKEQLAGELSVTTIDKFPPIEELVEAMYRETPIPPGVVADAYCAISERLSGRACP